MSNIIRALFGASTIFLGSACAEEDTFVSFPGIMTKEIAFAHKDFMFSAKYLECFELLLDAKNDIHYITFLWVNDKPNEGEVLLFGGDRSEECGKEVSYEFDANTGEFLRKVYQK